jgi:NSS family neurotransmitter:Na+ symporter
MGQRSKPMFKWVGRLAVVMSLVVLSYYAVISGWVLHFMTQFFVALFVDTEGAASKTNLAALMSNGWLQLMLASAHLLITIVVVVKGVQEGLEKWISYMMPLFAVLVAVLLVKSFSLPSTPEVLRFLFYPDFSKLTLSSLNHALGHVFFTLSVGFGTMVTFGSYLREEDHVPTAGFRVALVDTLISLLAVVMIFPVAFQASNVPLTDPALMFEVLLPSELTSRAVQVLSAPVLDFAVIISENVPVPSVMPPSVWIQSGRMSFHPTLYSSVMVTSG